MEKETVEKNFLELIQDIYDAELQIVKALPEMIETAAYEELKTAFNHHLKETKKQVNRLEIIFKHLNKSPKRKTCQGIRGLIKEGKEIIEKKDISASFKDACLIIAAQKIEHYEIATYGALCALVKHLSHALPSFQTKFNKIYALLKETLNEEKSTDLKLTKLGEGTKHIQGINEEAEKEIISCCR